MKTVGCGLLQVPVVSHYRDTILRKQDLSQCVVGTAWKMIFQNALRLTLLCVWGMRNINTSYPEARDRRFAVYIEMGTLGIGILVGTITVFARLFKKIPLLYPALVSVPFCFIVDFFIKATCYAYLFLYPYITMFGVFSMIEFWWRHLTLLYHWLCLISFIHTSKDFVDPFTAKRAEEPQITTVAAGTTISGGSGADGTPAGGEKSCVLVDFRKTAPPVWRKPRSADEKKTPPDPPSRRRSSRDSSPERGDAASVNGDAGAVRLARSRSLRKGGFVPSILRSSGGGGELDASQIEFECDDDDLPVTFAPAQDGIEGSVASAMTKRQSIRGSAKRSNHTAASSTTSSRVKKSSS